jgi:Mce-associated membrane protein
VAILVVMTLHQKWVSEARDNGLRSATSATQSVLSFSAPTIDADVDRARTLVTGHFAEQYSALCQQVIEPQARLHGTTTIATVTRSAIVSAAPNSLVALLYINQTTTNKSVPQPNVTPGKVKVTVIKIGENWLISEFQPL